MKEVKVQRIISIICSIVGLIISLYGLLAGLESIGSTGFGGLGVIYIFPSIIALIIIILDLLITVDKIKKGLVYSCISSLIKIVTIICFIPSTIYNFKYEAEYGVSNLSFDLLIIFLLVIILIPSILNIIKLIKFKKNSKKLFIT